MTEAMEHLAVKAAVTETEQGSFSAIAAAWTRDRTNERIVRGAFRDTIQRWKDAGRDVPLVWDHSRNAHDIIGSIDSSSMQEQAAGLYVEGRLDLEDSELAREAWRSVKRGRVSLSFGYLTEGEREGRDGIKELTQLDLMEVTLTSVPANADARILGFKSEPSPAWADPVCNLPRELIGTGLDPLITGRYPDQAEIDAELKAVRMARPVQVASFLIE
jgi:HK97 family phage prohead protease